MNYVRYVALGDSQTEGLNDGDEVAGYRGWADRLATVLVDGEYLDERKRVPMIFGDTPAECVALATAAARNRG